jgi:hypothetical protein
MTVAEAYKAGRGKARWTMNDIMERADGRLKACAIGAFGIGMGILDPKKQDDWAAKSDARRVFSTLLEDVKIPYECDHKDLFSGYPEHPAVVIEHYSDEHRRGLGSDKNLVALMEQYEKN